MPQPDLWASNRVILCHFDSHRAALVFALWGGTLLLPQALPGGLPTDPAAVAGPQHRGEAVQTAVINRYGFNSIELVREPRFDAWLTGGTGAVRVHLLRFITFEPPSHAVQEHGGQFRPLSALRRADRLELIFLRRAFDIIIGNAGSPGRV